MDGTGTELLCTMAEEMAFTSPHPTPMEPTSTLLLWQEHERQLHQGQDVRLQQARKVSTEIRMLRRYVLCPADHHPHQTFISCPCHYHHLLKKTYFEAEVFELCQVGPMTLRDRLCEAAKQELSKTAQPLINPEGQLPYAYLLPKPSKQFEKARPIISYMLSWNAKLGQVIGTIVYELCRSIFGDHQLDRTVQDIIEDIQHQFFQTPTDVELNLQQQDLSGFFNSVPHSRMIDAVTYAVNHYMVKNGLPPGSTSEHIHRKRRSHSKNFSRQISTSRQEVYEPPTFRNPYTGNFPAETLLLDSWQPCLSPNSRSIYGQPVCPCTLWTGRSISGILFLQSLSRHEDFSQTSSQYQVCGQPYHDAFPRMATTLALGHFHCTGFLQCAHIIGRG